MLLDLTYCMATVINNEMSGPKYAFYISGHKGLRTPLEVPLINKEEMALRIRRLKTSCCDDYVDIDSRAEGSPCQHCMVVLQEGH